MKPVAERDVRGMVQVGVQVRLGLELEHDDELEVRRADVVVGIAQDTSPPDSRAAYGRDGLAGTFEIGDQGAAVVQ